MKRPAFQFYPGDWRKDAALHSCSMAARGLWIEMLCVMHECTPYGYLAINGRALNVAQLARLVGEAERKVKRWLAELEDAGVFSRTETGWIYSRRMVSDEHLREVRAESGRLGGHSDWGKQKQSEEENLLKQKPSKTAAEGQANLKQTGKQKPPPSSSSSSSKRTNKNRGISIVIGSHPRACDEDEIPPDDWIPPDEQAWAHYFRTQHGVVLNPQNDHDRHRAWPIFSAWCKQQVTIGRMAEAVRRAHEMAREPITFLPAYVDRILASQAAQPPIRALLPHTKQAALESNNAQVANAWLAEMEKTPCTRMTPLNSKC